MMTIRSEGVICVLRNFWAAVCARIWSIIGMLVMSKNITSRRRSLYLTSPGLEGAIWLAVTAFTTGARGVAGASGALGSGTGAGVGALAGTGSGVTVSSSS